jgi:hypothetical protein
MFTMFWSCFGTAAEESQPGVEYSGGRHLQILVRHHIRFHQVLLVPAFDTAIIAVGR